MKKPRSDSILKNLTEDRQAEIAELCRQSLDQAAAALRAQGIKTSRTALGEWLSWYRLQQQLRRNVTIVETILDRMRQQNPPPSEEQLFLAGQLFFSALALEQQDPIGWSRVQRSAVDHKRFQRDTCELFLRWRDDQRANEIAASTATNADKIARLQQVMFDEPAAPAA